MSTTLPVLLLSAALAATACSSKKKESEVEAAPAPKKPAESAPPAPAPVAPSAEALAAHPLPFFALKDRVLFAKDAEAAELLRKIGEDGLLGTDLPASWKEQGEELQSIAALSGLEEGSHAAALASASVLCGRCHAAHEAKPTIAEAIDEPEGLSFEDHMSGHHWALNRMWAGLVVPSEELWQAGAKELAGAPSHFRNLSSYGDDADAAMSFANEVHSLAAKALETSDAEARGALFGTFIDACAGCHRLPASAPKAKDELFD